MLNIEKKQEGKDLTVALIGRLDTVTAPDLEKEIKDCVDSLTEMELNFAGLEYISSAGLRVLLATHKTMSKSGQLKIVNVNDTIMEIFEVTGFSDILEIA